MTLDTRIYIHDQIDVRSVFDFVNGQLGAAPDVMSKDTAGYANDGGRILMNRPIQGLPAWLMCYYRRGEETPEEFDEDDYMVHPAYWVCVSLDTAYGYSDEQGRNCSELHASLIVKLGEWLDDQGLSWSWRDEYTGDIHSGEERYRKLTALMSNGAAAQEWFTNTVMPLFKKNG